ncbi:MAG: 30S ribosomal protein S9 [Thermoleophilaceae bacterium]
MIDEEREEGATPEPEQPAEETEQPEAEEAEQPQAEEADQPQAEETEQPQAEETEQPQAEEPEPEQTEQQPEPEQAEPPAQEAEAPAAEPAAEADVEESAPDTSQAEEREERPPREHRPREDAPGDKPDVVPGAHLEPDLVLEEQAKEAEFPGYQEDVYEAQPEAAGEAPAEGADGAPADAPAARTPLDLAADARYQATGKRKTSVARVILKPGNGTYTINGRALDEFFPRPTLQLTARQPLETAGYETRMDVVAKIHGGGVSAQAGALRHGVARALVEADPNLRGELKRRGFLTRDARAKERKKAGLKKARKRPQFSKR